MSVSVDRPLHWPGTDDVPDEYGAFDQKLGELPESLRELDALAGIDLRDNRLTELPDWLAELPVLTKIDARWNPLTRLPPWAATFADRGGVLWA